jgi:GNAT superfamily N-acetyltransferase
MTFDSPTADELSLVFDSWANSFKKSPWSGCVPNHLWAELSRAAIADIIDRGARVLVAVQELPEGGRRVLGYSVSEPAKNVLHWLYVKGAYRGLGVGRALLAETCTPGEWTYTHRTRASDKFLRCTPARFRWDPVPARVRG